MDPATAPAPPPLFLKVDTDDGRFAYSYSDPSTSSSSLNSYFVPCSNGFIPLVAGLQIRVIEPDSRTQNAAIILEIVSSSLVASSIIQQQQQQQQQYQQQRMYHGRPVGVAHACLSSSTGNGYGNGDEGGGGGGGETQIIDEDSHGMNFSNDNSMQENSMNVAFSHNNTVNLLLGMNKSRLEEDEEGKKGEEEKEEGEQAGREENFGDTQQFLMATNQRINNMSTEIMKSRNITSLSKTPTPSSSSHNSKTNTQENTSSLPFPGASQQSTQKDSSDELTSSIAPPVPYNRCSNDIDTDDENATQEDSKNKVSEARNNMIATVSAALEQIINNGLSSTSMDTDDDDDDDDDDATQGEGIATQVPSEASQVDRFRASYEDLSNNNLSNTATSGYNSSKKSEEKSLSMDMQENHNDGDIDDDSDSDSVSVDLIDILSNSGSSSMSVNDVDEFNDDRDNSTSEQVGSSEAVAEGDMNCGGENGTTAGKVVYNSESDSEISNNSDTTEEEKEEVCENGTDVASKEGDTIAISNGERPADIINGNLAKESNPIFSAAAPSLSTAISTVPATPLIISPKPNTPGSGKMDYLDVINIDIAASGHAMSDKEPQVVSIDAKASATPVSVNSSTKKRQSTKEKEQEEEKEKKDDHSNSNVDIVALTGKSDEKSATKSSTKRKSTDSVSPASSSSSNEMAFSSSSNSNSNSSSILSSNSNVTSTNKRSKTEKEVIKIIFSGIVKDEKEDRWAQRIGASVVENPQEATHIIIGKEANELKRTCKLLVALNSGVKHVISLAWLKDSADKANKALPISENASCKYTVVDKDKEKLWKFNLKGTLQKDRVYGDGVFNGMTFYITYEESEKGWKVLSKEDMRQIVESGGGTLIDTLDAFTAAKSSQMKDFVIISNDTTVAASLKGQKNNLSKWINSGAHRVFSPEFIYLSVLRQQLASAAECAISLSGK